jgi:hypothetical protein
MVRTFLPRVPIPPGPWKSDFAEKWVVEDDRFRDVPGLSAAYASDCAEPGEGGMRGKSSDVVGVRRGVPRSGYGFDFRRARGK